ncbi:MAG TPA: F0F1 ATP synthase subunit delta [Pseudonocardia sp.]|uniref:F0F1 ATP synthase subunit delta n=1 Tax=Pseudonocardia sp. TaxID=60912 RepID=UPI002CA0B366|nr:F0F1 ATP synthase subunit delta [Pseudonocardia sp.]HTF47139.1 F0F1 ATP synthase subunit delta [Pseudonocardia sp.]
MALQLQAASRESLAEAEARLDSRVDSASVTELATLGEELFEVMRLLINEPGLRRHLADSSVPGANRSQLADQLLSRQLGRAALDTVSDLVSARWSRPSDLVEAVEVLARRATFAVAEKDGTLAEVEDELFRFGRILDSEPALASLLADPNAPEDRRVALLDQVLGQKVRPVTKALLEQTVRSPRGRSLDLAAEELSELAAARRDRYVAHVGTPVALTAQQEQRLTDTLSRLYGRQMSLQIELDPTLLGGLVVRVGGEVIDGSVSSRLSAAKRALPR